MKRAIFALAIGLSICSSPSLAKKKVQLTPMELQSLQSKEFETSKGILFASVMSVLQDLGYTVDSADIETGFIKGNSPIDDKVNFFEAMGGVTSARNSRVTAFVEQMFEGRAKVRLNFVNSKENSSWYGQTNKKDSPVIDPKTYQVAWEKVDEAIFVRAATAEAKPTPAVQPIEAVATPK